MVVRIKNNMKNVGKGKRLNFSFINAGYFLNHFLLLLFASIAALKLSDQCEMTYTQLVPYATPSFTASGLLFSIHSVAAGCICAVVLFLPSDQLKIREG